MADRTEAAKPGPAIPPAVMEVEGIFPSDAALQDAVARLTQAGFDRADLSLPEATPATAEATPEAGAAAVTTETDVRQARTLGTGLAASAAGMAAAGVIIATGGAAAVAVGAAAAAGVGTAAITEAAGKAVESTGKDTREQAASRGELVLAVRAVETPRQDLARELMQASGATRVETVRRTGGTIEPA